mmetsp:Transcript_60804/g.101005  ORF Transcript_60804/g.101005 Transcript_60804/m.101005 type:complete len:100 (-) Transcript_60804:449-748(-)
MSSIIADSTKEWRLMIDHRRLTRLQVFQSGRGRGDVVFDKSIAINQGKYIEKMVTKFIASSKARECKPTMPCEATSFQKLRCAVNDNKRDRVSSHTLSS